MPYINTEYLFKCETCRHCVGDIRCNTFCDSGESYSPNMNKIPAADVVPMEEVERLKRQLEPFKEKQCFTCKHYDIGHDHVPCCYCEDYNKYIWLSADADTDIYTSDESELAKVRAEVAREIFEEIEKIINKNYESALNNEEDEELEAATDYMSYISCDLEELKKKYTEAEPPKGD